MIPNTFFRDQPYTEAEEWFTGPWFREEVAKPLLDLKKSRGFALIERGRVGKRLLQSARLKYMLAAS